MKGLPKEGLLGMPSSRSCRFAIDSDVEPVDTTSVTSGAPSMLGSDVSKEIETKYSRHITIIIDTNSTIKKPLSEKTKFIEQIINQHLTLEISQL
jgi:hypothetical protein